MKREECFMSAPTFWKPMISRKSSEIQTYKALGRRDLSLSEKIFRNTAKLFEDSRHTKYWYFD